MDFTKQRTSDKMERITTQTLQEKKEKEYMALAILQNFRKISGFIFIVMLIG